MIVGIGIDLVEIERLAKALGAPHGPRFEERVFTEGERADCAGRGAQGRIACLAARFAAKEACLKALGTGWSEGLSFRQVEVVRSSDGAPRLVLSGRAAERAGSMSVRGLHLSVTHERGVAGAVVVLET
jgi:holo-[acyl-carrier protein] synthase